jgi:hypothetical protein
VTARNLQEASAKLIEIEAKLNGPNRGRRPFHPATAKQ